MLGVVTTAWRHAAVLVGSAVAAREHACTGSAEVEQRRR
jgi:hypothetical protein